MVGSAKVTGGTITSTSTGYAAVLIGNVSGTEDGSITIVNAKITGANQSIRNSTDSYSKCRIYYRASGYGITGTVVGKVIATTNTSTLQSQENVTIYNTGYTSLNWATWTNLNGQDDLTWETTSSSTGTHTYTVKKSSHNYETGTYYVDVYNSTKESYIGGITLTF